jgi:hypothetical protein
MRWLSRPAVAKEHRSIRGIPRGEEADRSAACEPRGQYAGATRLLSLSIRDESSSDPVLPPATSTAIARAATRARRYVDVVRVQDTKRTRALFRRQVRPPVKALTKQRIPNVRCPAGNDRNYSLYSSRAISATPDKPPSENPPTCWV